MGKGLPVVLEGQRINLRVYRRLFNALAKDIEGEKYTLYSDTGTEKEIRYASPEYYGLDNPFNRIRLYRLARAMNCLRCAEGDGVKECSVTICRTKELYGADAREEGWVPFDPERLESLEDRVRSLRRRVEWKRRMGAS
ncbi:hypothetical protein JXL21_12285 [Candidatus Bathyarchaeota archaeon]|nr:hypothetical protein [Candidatus Bathyarchaeota archaeon]